jgi:Lon protease-like protein
MSGEESMTRWADLPLFPLNTVLFPGMVLPLHIFEERYKLLAARCLQEERPFGVVLIREGRESGPNAVPYGVGTTALIASASRLQDGRMNLVTIGCERFRIRSLRYDQPYLAGEAEHWPLAEAVDVRTTKQAEPVGALFRQYLDLLVLAEGHRIEVEDMPTDARTLALLIAIALQIPMVQKQHLLGRATVADMLRAERTILRREQLLLHHVIQTQNEQWEGGFSGFLARN